MSPDIPGYPQKVRRSSQALAVPEIPEPSTGLTIEEVEELSRAIVVWSERAPAQAVVDRLDQSLAVERWLRKRKMEGPMQTACRHLERAIGLHLGAAVNGRPRKKRPESHISLADNDDTDRKLKVQFRLLAEHWDDIVSRLPLTRAAALKIARARRRGLTALEDVEFPEIHHASCAGLVDIIGPESVDVIITDPPYRPEYLDCYAELSWAAEQLLRPGGQCWAMAGHRLLPDVMARLSGGLDYYWTVAYLTPGGQSVSIWDRKVNTFWKPVLVYAKPGKKPDRWFGDVARSEINDNDSDAHPAGWAQSDSGLADLVRRASEPGWVVCDPFLGAGSTALAAASLGRRFIGADIDAERVEQARRRVGG